MKRTWHSGGWLLLTFLFTGVTTSALAEDLLIRGALIRVIEQADVPSREAGSLIAFDVKEGMQVQRGQRLGRLDDRVEVLQLQQAELELELARRTAEHGGLVELAENLLNQKSQAAAEHDFLKRILRQQADNPLKVEAAKKQLQVARNELDRAQRAREGFANSVSASEIDARQLAAGHADLSLQQAEFEQRIDVLKAEAEELAVKSRQLAVDGAKIELDNAEHQLRLAKLGVHVQQNKVRAAQLAMERRNIEAPLSGTVVEVKPHVGEWLEPGVVVVRIVNLERLRAEGFVSVNTLAALSPGMPLQLVGNPLDPKAPRCEAVLTFISPEVDPVNQEVRIWAEFENTGHKFLPGMRPSLIGQLPPK